MSLDNARTRLWRMCAYRSNWTSWWRTCTRLTPTSCAASSPTSWSRQVLSDLRRPSLTLTPSPRVSTPPPFKPLPLPSILLRDIVIYIQVHVPTKISTPVIRSHAHSRTTRYVKNEDRSTLCSLFQSQPLPQLFIPGFKIPTFGVPNVSFLNSVYRYSWLAWRHRVWSWLRSNRRKVWKDWWRICTLHTPTSSGALFPTKTKRQVLLPWQ